MYRDLDSFRLVAERLNFIGGQAAKAGLRVAYHNHDFEFLPHAGKIGYDIIMNETDPALVKLQLQPGATVSGLDVEPEVPAAAAASTNFRRVSIGA